MTKIKQAQTLESEGNPEQLRYATEEVKHFFFPRHEIHVDPETAFVPQWSLMRSPEERARAAVGRNYDYLLVDLAQLNLFVFLIFILT